MTTRFERRVTRRTAAAALLASEAELANEHCNLISLPDELFSRVISCFVGCGHSVQDAAKRQGAVHSIYGSRMQPETSAAGARNATHHISQLSSGTLTPVVTSGDSRGGGASAAESELTSLPGASSAATTSAAGAQCSEHVQQQRAAKDLAILACVCRRLCRSAHGLLGDLARQQVHILWRGAPLRDLPTGCCSWQHLLWMLEERAVAVSFRWKIEGWSAFQKEASTRTYSTKNFQAGDFDWRLLLFPRGNTVPYLSLYLAVANEFRSSLPADWTKFARFALIVPNENQAPLVKVTQHQFDNREDDWGFTQFIELSALNDESKGWVVNDTLTVEVLILPFSWVVRQYVILSWTGELATEIES
eukprot:CAMPEP_0183800928 /NCGR_PEP_ID=MMETSP0803_2-20130417/26355_1 /TAXON_ID=195967 /ORGANISM="Crustomastix stigmata, Strain CCMP3273" /LENGTH=361 /DNA_ID=CAMNT_0026045647 /DNA_START=34 /DNA_END=1119 /DNA_ORIENTATION=-